ncbi:MAG: hypothetical protein ACOCTM_01850 [Bacteroidota bacterium]
MFFLFSNKITSWLLIFVAFLWSQVSSPETRVISDALDYGISLVLVIMAIVALWLHYLKDIKNRREAYRKIAEQNQKKDERFEQLFRDHIHVSKEQVITNKELKEQISSLEQYIRGASLWEEKRKKYTRKKSNL